MSELQTKISGFVDSRVPGQGHAPSEGARKLRAVKAWLVEAPDDRTHVDSLLNALRLLFEVASNDVDERRRSAPPGMHVDALTKLRAQVADTDDPVARLHLAGALSARLEASWSDVRDTEWRDRLWAEIRDLVLTHPDRHHELSYVWWQLDTGLEQDRCIPDLEDRILAERRALLQAHPREARLVNDLAGYLHTVIQRAMDGNQAHRRDTLLDELRALVSRHADAPELQDQFANTLRSVIDVVRGKDDRDLRKTLSAELRTLRSGSPQDRRAE